MHGIVSDSHTAVVVQRDGPVAIQVQDAGLEPHVLKRHAVVFAKELSRQPVQK